MNTQTLVGDEELDSEFDAFFEFPGAGRSMVSAFSAKLFARHIAARAAISTPAQPAAGETVRDMEARKDAAYLERNQVVAALAKCFPSGVARTAIEGWSEDWHGCVYIDLPTGQASWHFHDSQAYLFADFPPYVGAWDGHTTEEKYERIARLAAPQPAQVAEPVRQAGEGIQIVPTVPTREMIDAGAHSVNMNYHANSIHGIAMHAYADMLKAAPYLPQQAQGTEPLQARVRPWLAACFGAEIAGDKVERNHRFLEEALELVHSTGCTQSEAHQLVDYVFGRPVGEPYQEVGGVMITLAALCLANGLDMHAAGETELARIWTKVEKIRAKQAAKPKHSPLPMAAQGSESGEAEKIAKRAEAILKLVDEFGSARYHRANIYAANVRSEIGRSLCLLIDGPAANDQRDAARYRKLRTELLWAEQSNGEIKWVAYLNGPQPGDDGAAGLDALIDAAIAAQAPGGAKP